MEKLTEPEKKAQIILFTHLRRANPESVARAKSVLVEYPKLAHLARYGQIWPLTESIAGDNLDIVKCLIEDNGVHPTESDLKLAKFRFLHRASGESDKQKQIQQEILMVVEKAIENLAKTEQEGKEAQIAALNSTTLGQKLPEDVIRKISEYGGRKRKTRNRKPNKRKTICRRK